MGSVSIDAGYVFKLNVINTLSAIDAGALPLGSTEEAIENYAEVVGGLDEDLDVEIVKRRLKEKSETSPASVIGAMISTMDLFASMGVFPSMELFHKQINLVSEDVGNLIEPFVVTSSPLDEFATPKDWGIKSQQIRKEFLQSPTGNLEVYREHLSHAQFKQSQYGYAWVAPTIKIIGAAITGAKLGYTLAKLYHKMSDSVTEPPDQKPDNDQGAISTGLNVADPNGDVNVTVEEPDARTTKEIDVDLDKVDEKLRKNDNDYGDKKKNEDDWRKEKEELEKRKDQLEKEREQAQKREDDRKQREEKKDEKSDEEKSSYATSGDSSATMERPEGDAEGNGYCENNPNDPQCQAMTTLAVSPFLEASLNFNQLMSIAIDNKASVKIGLSGLMNLRPSTNAKFNFSYKSPEQFIQTDIQRIAGRHRIELRIPDVPRIGS